MEPIPVTVITGALGSGKTTFVNYILTEQHGFKIGVIVNEFGAVGIDSEILVASKEKLIELPNGCVCCEVRDDLRVAAKELIASRKIDYLIVETSGLAEMIPVAMTFALPELVEKTVLDSIICVVDCENFDENLKRSKTAKEQLESADIVLLNKVDLAGKKRVEDIRMQLKKLMPNAQTLETVKGKADLRLLLDVKKFDSQKQLHWERKDHSHAHDPSIQSVSFVLGPLEPDKLNEFFDSLPESIFRAKGIVCIQESAKGEGDELRVIFQKVGKRWDLEFSRPWEDGEKKETKIVFIGKGIDEQKLREGLKACV